MVFIDDWKLQVVATADFPNRPCRGLLGRRDQVSFSALAVVVLLVILNGFFVAVEFAFTASRRQTLEEVAEGGSRFARMALSAMDELPVTFAGAQLGVAGASLALGFVIEESLQTSFEGLLRMGRLAPGRDRHFCHCHCASDRLFRSQRLW